ncbi:MAG: DUF2911 domain-containing protein [Gemmatimonadaceae bacterium]
MIRRLFLAALVIPLPVTAQIRASEQSLVSQTIDGTKITVEYSRPRARGRATLFGTKAVHWGETWTPGANWATTLELNRDIRLNGQAVPKGKYSVWMVVKESGAWTVVLDTLSHRFHMNPPDSSLALIRIPAIPQTIPFTEVLTWSMPELRVNGATLAMDWERIRIPLKIDVEPSLVLTFPAAEAADYVGRYTFKEAGPPGKEKVSKLTITHEDGTLKAQFDPNDSYLRKFALVRLAPDWFASGVYDSTGQIYEVLKPDMVFEFTREKGRPVKFVIRDGDDELWGTGVRER